MKFRKKPVVIEAIQWTGDIESELAINRMSTAESVPMTDILRISTLEGVMTANLWDWIIWDVKGKIYLCKPDIFKATYERVDSDMESTK